MQISLRLLSLPLFASIVFLFNMNNGLHLAKLSNIDMKVDKVNLQTGWYVVVDSSAYKRKYNRKGTSYFLDFGPICTVGDFKAETIYANKEGSYEMSFTLSEGAMLAWKSNCYEDIGRKFAFVLNNEIIEIALVNKAMKNGFVALKENAYTELELKTIKQEIEKEKKRRYSDEE